MNGAVVTFPPSFMEADCPGGLEWAWHAFGECIRATSDKISTAFGVICIAAWILFAIPQILENYSKKIPDAAVSECLLIFSLLVDTLNFIGAFLAGQLILQKFLAGYFVLVYFILIAQYCYYKRIHRINLKREAKLGDPSEKDDVKDGHGKILAGVVLGYLALCAGPPALQIRKLVSTLGPSDYRNRKLFESPANPSIPFDNFLPWRRKSTDGLSFYPFLLAILGNIFYAGQLFIESVDAIFVLTALPCILGSLGILVFDAFILVQFFKYRGRTGPEDLERTYEDAEGNSSSGK